MYWFGSQESYDTVERAKVQLSATLAKSENKGLLGMELPSLYSRDGDVGVINIQGSLVEGSSGWMRLFGVTGYDDISAAVLEGIKDKGAKSLVYTINSGGGQVNGVSAAAELIHNAAQVKPSNVYATSMIASAAYWLGSAAGHITLDEASMAGSLGVFKVYTNVQGALAKEGITKTILRSGKYKVALNPYEEPTDEILAEAQAQLDQLRDMFLSAVANYRGGTAESVNNRMGEGREFLGKRALDVGLVDQIGGLADAISYSRSKVSGFKPVKAVNL